MYINAPSMESGKACESISTNPTGNVHILVYGSTYQKSALGKNRVTRDPNYSSRVMQKRLKRDHIFVIAVRPINSRNPSTLRSEIFHNLYMELYVYTSWSSITSLVIRECITHSSDTTIEALRFITSLTGTVN